MSRSTWVLLASALVLTTACAPMRYAFDHDRQVDFSRFRSYSWTALMPADRWEQMQRDDLVIRRVVARVDQALKSRGYELVQAKGDFQVAFTPLLRTRLVTSGYGDWTSVYSETRKVKEAGIQLDILEGSTRRVVWTGFAGGGFQGRLDSEELDEKVGEAVEGLLQNFPPRNRIND